MTWVLAVAALAAGLTGAWSPCGFSMVETLAPAGYAGRLRTTLVACATFTVGALVGGVITFGGLGLLGQWLGAGGTGAAAVAAVIAIAAAIGEARGVRIVPQVRRQVPESWRRVLPVPLAAGLYGVLLGLGFTTFILTFAVWALAAVSVALGDPALGAVLGLAFGAGRALPVIALAPVAETDRGNAAHAAMAERPAILRGLRVADAVALAACAVAMTTVAPASAQRTKLAIGDPVRCFGPERRGRVPLVPAAGPRRGRLSPRPERDLRPARPRSRRRRRPRRLARPPTARSCSRDPTRSLRWRPTPRRAPARSRSATSGSCGWSARRSSSCNHATPRRRRASIASARPGEQLGRPSIVGSTIVFHRAGKAGSSIRLFDLATGRESLLRSERRALLSNPSFDGRRVLYVRSTYTLQELRLGILQRRSTTRDRALYRTTPTARRDASHEPGHHRHSAGYKGGKPPPLAPRPPAGVVDTLWTTALGPSAAYVTRLRKKSGVTTATLLSVPR